MAGYLLDTNQLSEALKPVSRVRERIELARRAGVRVGTSFPAICELEAAFRPVGRREAYRRALRQLLDRVRVWPMGVTVAKLYGEIYLDLRSRGRVLSQVDMMLAALASEMDLTLVTADRDFEALPKLPTENWLA